MKRETISVSRTNLGRSRELSHSATRRASVQIEPVSITAASKVIDYDWVTINDQPHLLPSRRRRTDGA